MNSVEKILEKIIRDYVLENDLTQAEFYEKICSIKEQASASGKKLKEAFSEGSMAER